MFVFLSVMILGAHLVSISWHTVLSILYIIYSNHADVSSYSSLLRFVNTDSILFWCFIKYINVNWIFRVVLEWFRANPDHSHCHTDADGKISVKFGVLFNDDQCANLFEALVGTLKAAKRKKIITFEGELLLQGVHDNVDVILLQDWI